MSETTTPTITIPKLTLAEARKIARDRVWSWGDSECTAAVAWRTVATVRRTRVTPPGWYYEAHDDAWASECPELIGAVRRIAQRDLEYIATCPDTPKNRQLAADIREAVGLDEAA